MLVLPVVWIAKPSMGTASAGIWAYPRWMGALALMGCLVSLGLPVSGCQPPRWHGGFETGNFAQWDQLDGNLLARSRYFRLVRSPVFEGKYAFRSTVDAGAMGRGEHGQRAMVLLFPSNEAARSRTGAYEGSERWYRSHVYFPKSFHPSPRSSWNWLVQWHNWPNGPCCSNLALHVDSRKGPGALTLRVMGGGDRDHPVENNDIITEENPAGQLHEFVGARRLRHRHWYDSVVHVRW